jgi:hypothetical protein
VSRYDNNNTPYCWGLFHDRRSFVNSSILRSLIVNPHTPIRQFDRQGQPRSQCSGMGLLRINRELTQETRLDSCMAQHGPGFDGNCKRSSLVLLFSVVPPPSGCAASNIDRSTARMIACTYPAARQPLSMVESELDTLSLCCRKRVRLPTSSLRNHVSSISTPFLSSPLHSYLVFLFLILFCCCTLEKTSLNSLPAGIAAALAFFYTFDDNNFLSSIYLHQPDLIGSPHL